MTTAGIPAHSAADNPLLNPSTLECELPDFAALTPQHFVTAVAALRERQTEVLEQIVTSDEPATFDNTVLRLEAQVRDVTRVLAPFFTLTNCDLTPELEAVQEDVNRTATAMENELLLHRGLYERLRTVAASEQLSAEQRRVVERRVREMTLAGAGLPDADAQRVKEINERLTTLGTHFDQKVLADTQDLAVHCTDAAELDGLRAAEIEQAQQAAAARGLDGYLIPLTYPTGHAYLARLTNRDVRRRLMEASLARGSRGNADDTRTLILEVMRLRAERAQVLGFAHHAVWATAGGTAKTPEAVLEMLTPIAATTAQNVRAEQERLERMAAADGVTDFAAWDWDFYAEKVRAAEYDVDTDALRQYFELEAVVTDGVFAAATELYGLTFHRRHDLAGWNDDTRVYDVRAEDGRRCGLFLLDPWARDTKKGGAWMHELVQQNRTFGQLPVICNNLNVTKPSGDQPALLTFDEVETFFHEFGHALHGLLSDVEYPSVSGTNVERDFVEFPSQVNEMWMLWPSLVQRYAKHVETGEPLAPKALERLEQARTFNQGFAMAEFLSAALIDFEWHRLRADEVGREPDAVDAFDADVRSRYGLDSDVVMSRYYTPYFQHIVSGGYAAGYYGYLWAEVLDADSVQWFRENGGLTRANGRHFAQTVLSVGGSVEAMSAFASFRGRGPNPDALLRRRGLVTG